MVNLNTRSCPTAMLLVELIARTVGIGVDHVGA